MIEAFVLQTFVSDIKFWNSMVIRCRWEFVLRDVTLNPRFMSSSGWILILRDELATIIWVFVLCELEIVEIGALEVENFGLKLSDFPAIMSIFSPLVSKGATIMA